MSTCKQNKSIGNYMEDKLVGYLLFVSFNINLVDPAAALDLDVDSAVIICSPMKMTTMHV